MINKKNALAAGITVLASLAVAGSVIVSVRVNDNKKPSQETVSSEVKEDKKDNQKDKKKEIVIKKRDKKEESKAEPVKAEVPGQLKDGQYEGSAKGYGGRLKVLVTVKDGKISDVKVTSHSETPEYYASASSIIADIIKNNTPNVDSVSGATVSSNAIKSAVRDALSKAGAKIKSNDVAPKNVGSKAPADGRKAAPGNYSLTPQESAQEGLEDGSYIGNGQGFGGNIRVRVTVSGGKVSNIELLSHRDDAPYINWAKDGVIPSILSGNTSVDTVGGATYSSRGIIDAVANALSKAVKKTAGPAKKPVLPTVSPNAPKEVKPLSPNKPNIIKPIDQDYSKENIDDLLKPYYVDKPLADGEYIGYDYGYYRDGSTLRQKGIKSIVRIVGGEVESVTIPEEEFPDDHAYYKTALPVVNHLKGKNVRLFGAQMALFGDYTYKILKASDPYAKAKELLGEKHAAPLKGHTPSELGVSEAVRRFMESRFSTGPIFDTISSATYSGSGMVKSVRNAVENSAKDYETKNDVQDLEIVLNDDIHMSNKNIILKANRKEKLNLSSLQVKIIKKDGKSEIVPISDFKAKGLVMKNRETGKEVTDKMDISKMEHFSIEIEHTNSKKRAFFLVQVGYFSKDYIVGLHYSKDGKNWYEVSNLNKDKAEPENISYLSQKIDAPESFRLKEIKLRAVSKNGKFYEYSAGAIASEGKEQRYELVKKLEEEDEDYNSNLSPFMHISFHFSGDVKSKKLVEGDGQEVADTTAKEVVADAHTLATDMDTSGENLICTDGVAIKPLKVFSKQAGIRIVEVKNLPEGLSYNEAEGAIVGTPRYVGDDKADLFMEYNIILVGENITDKTRYVRKIETEQVSKRLLKVYVTKDFDLDGLTGREEENPLSFDARQDGIKVLEVNGKEPTIKDYTDTLSNFPNSGVKAELKVKPDYTKVGDLQKATLIFKVPSLEGRKGYKEGSIQIYVRVKKAVEDTVKPAEAGKDTLTTPAPTNKVVEPKAQVTKGSEKETKKEEAGLSPEKKDSNLPKKEDKKEEKPLAKGAAKEEKQEFDKKEEAKKEDLVEKKEENLSETEPSTPIKEEKVEEKEALPDTSDTPVSESVETGK